MKKHKLKSEFAYLGQVYLKRFMGVAFSFILVSATGILIMGVMHLSARKTTDSDTPFKRGEVLSAQDVKTMKSVINPSNSKQYNCPPSSLVKGILDVDGKKYYLEPNNSQYLYTKPDSCFNSSETAQSEGYDSHIKNQAQVVNPEQNQNNDPASNSTEAQNTVYEATSDNLLKLDAGQTKPAEAIKTDISAQNPDFEQMLQRSNTQKIIVVNLAQQNLKTLEAGQIKIDTKITSGKKTFDTPVGARTVINKAKNIRLKAPSPRFGDYDLPVKYWVGIGNGYGFHDASWRASFGGEDFVSNGSHGCINMPLEAVKSLYDWADIGTEVYII